MSQIAASHERLSGVVPLRAGGQPAGAVHMLRHRGPAQALRGAKKAGRGGAAPAVRQRRHAAVRMILGCEESDRHLRNYKT